MPEAKNENRQRQRRHQDERQPPGKKQAQPIPQIIHRLEQKLVDVALADVGGDLPVVLVHRRKDVHHRDHQVVKNHLRLGESALPPGPPVAAVNRPPQRQHGEQRDEAEQRPRQIIEAVLQVVLKTDADDVQVFFHRDGI